MKNYAVAHLLHVLTSILKMGIPLVSVFPSPHKLVPGTFQNKVLLQVITTELYL